MCIRIRLLASVGLVTCAALGAVTVDAGPPAWADKDLKVVDGLVAWYDAAAQARAREAAGAPSLEANAPVDQWLDSSGNDRHATQDDAEARPKLHIAKDIAAMRFGGGGEHFSLKAPGRVQNEMTVVVVAAPAGNPGGFRGLFSAREATKDDFQTGVNIDLGAFASSRFDVLNVEGAGSVGMANLRTKADPFLGFHRIAVTSQAGPEGVALHIDGRVEGRRARTAPAIRMDQLFIGARGYGGELPRGFFEGEIAEVILYDRILSAEELAAVDGYLAKKYENAPLIEPIGGKDRPRVIARVADPPAVQMLVPGFTARSLPLKLPNVNNVLYREDGALLALGYNGNVYLLKDQDGDGLEESEQLFWENTGDLRAPIGMALIPDGYRLGRGVAVAAKSKCVMLLDTDGDDQADREVVVADGWQELFHGVDALGVAFDPVDQSIYFGLGTANFTDAYLIGDDAKADYRLDSERGTVLRVAPDLKSRSIVATGIRFPVALRFNKHHDLFCTDQEGATWLPNGNPFDELLHVQRGRHYGFPPRHPRYLPEVIDEPSVFDYRPQHQSTCGLNFNEPAGDGTSFGPDWWRSDALVAGYSRGKLYRTKLARTNNGYVAQNQLIGSFAAMPADACVAPDHSLVVAAHSGGPDWGSGPSGEGMLYKISYADRQAPVPSLVWAEHAHEVRIAFDRPIDSETLKGLASRIAIESGEFVAAGDRLEVIRPGYASVEFQQNAPTARLEVHGVQVTSDHRTVILSTSAHQAAHTFAIAMPNFRQSSKAEPQGAITQLPDVDLQYDLSGVEASWQASSGSGWSGWLPHVDLAVSREFTVGSSIHDELWSRLRQPGELKLKTSLDLQDMLRSITQIGSTVDYTLPQEQVTLTLRASCPFEGSVDGRSVQADREGERQWIAHVDVASNDAARRPLEVRLQHEGEGAPPTLTIAFHTAEDARPRALPLQRFVLPWAPQPSAEPTVIDNRTLPELAGGHWLRGQQLFFGTEAGCSKCHTVRGVGGTIGPDLSNLTKRDYASVVRDITQPSFAINPDHVTQVVMTIDGLVHTGTVRTEGEQLIISDTEGKQTAIGRADVEEVRASELSIMPEGIPKALGPERFRDLLTYLLVDPPSMPVYGDQIPPAERNRAAVEAVLAGSDNDVSVVTKPLHVVLVAGPKDHGLGEHDYPAWQTAWRLLFELDEHVKVTTANPWPSEEDLKTADVLVFYQQGAWTPERERDLDRFLRRGKGAVYIHYAVDGGADPAGMARYSGLAWQGGRSKFRHGALDIDFASGREHPIARNFDKVHFHDESYWNLVESKQKINLLATGVEDEQPQPLFWTVDAEGGGRIFVSIPGHFAWTFDDPLFRVLLLRGIAWAGGASVDRFNELVWPGARVTAAATQSP